MARAEIKVGEQHGRLTVLEQDGDDAWIVRCRCGRIVTVPTRRLRKTRRCSCDPCLNFGSLVGERKWDERSIVQDLAKGNLAKAGR